MLNKLLEKYQELRKNAAHSNSFDLDEFRAAAAEAAQEGKTSSTSNEELWQRIVNIPDYAAALILHSNGFEMRNYMDKEVEVVKAGEETKKCSFQQYLLEAASKELAKKEDSKLAKEAGEFTYYLNLGYTKLDLKRYRTNAREASIIVWNAHLYENKKSHSCTPMEAFTIGMTLYNPKYERTNPKHQKIHDFIEVCMKKAENTDKKVRIFVEAIKEKHIPLKKKIFKINTLTFTALEFLRVRCKHKGMLSLYLKTLESVDPDYDKSFEANKDLWITAISKNDTDGLRILLEKFEYSKEDLENCEIDAASRTFDVSKEVRTYDFLNRWRNTGIQNPKHKANLIVSALFRSIYQPEVEDLGEQKTFIEILLDKGIVDINETLELEGKKFSLVRLCFLATIADYSSIKKPVCLERLLQRDDFDKTAIENSELWLDVIKFSFAGDNLNHGNRRAIKRKLWKLLFENGIEIEQMFQAPFPNIELNTDESPYNVERGRGLKQKFNWHIIDTIIGNDSLEDIEFDITSIRLLHHFFRKDRWAAKRLGHVIGERIPKIQIPNRTHTLLYRIATFAASIENKESTEYTEACYLICYLLHIREIQKHAANSLDPLLTPKSPISDKNETPHFANYLRGDQEAINNLFFALAINYRANDIKLLREECLRPSNWIEPAGTFYDAIQVAFAVQGQDKRDAKVLRELELMGCTSAFTVNITVGLLLGTITLVGSVALSAAFVMMGGVLTSSVLSTALICGTSSIAVGLAGFAASEQDLSPNFVKESSAWIAASIYRYIMYITANKNDAQEAYI